MILTFDIGGTKLASAVVDARRGKIAAYKKHQFVAGETAPEYLAYMVAIGKTLLKKHRKKNFEGIGISFGGPLSMDGKTVLKSQHVHGWEGVPLASIIEQELNLPTVLENDANAAALGEWRYGAGKGLDTCIYVQLSTGIGLGIILEGNLYKGKGLAGELGHLTVKNNGLLCACGKKGCLESYAAGWALKKFASKILDKSASAENLFDAYRQNNSHAQRIIGRAMSALALALNNAICLLDPEIIVLGGGITKSRDVIRAELFPALLTNAPPFLKDRWNLAFASLAGKETLLGAALLASRLSRKSFLKGPWKKS